MLHHREALRARVVVVSFAAPASLAAYRERFDLHDATLLCDEARAVYAAFGFDRATRRRVWLDPRVWRRYAALLRQGRRLEAPDEDVLQLGGDVLVDPDGRVAWIHRSTGPEDRPALGALLAARDDAG